MDLREIRNKPVSPEMEIETRAIQERWMKEALRGLPSENSTPSGIPQLSKGIMQFQRDIALLANEVPKLRADLRGLTELGAKIDALTAEVANLRAGLEAAA